MKPQRGMTLLEVMVALTVFALAGLAVMKTAIYQVSTLNRLELKTFAGWVAENQQVQLKLEKRWPETRWVSGVSSLGGERWFWRWQGVETGDAQFRALDVEVRRDKNSSASDAVLRSYVVKLRAPAG
ncbi:type II secretion system minor pseudopilin GspI [Symbiopectobacterium purcellii]|uniref:Type II secretion system protein I n=1 Tax=Symbiopectobacterium purcellii TaxID=2871826 RepID=A0ABX9AHA5_9ENTR|nr:type II secretion system minor pseudopilin GspI [Symbiopectobacterium purcellii]QZN94493.1 type II secretion system minor pseudopilin GspI [Symbiopectobacterium purcellii]